MGDNQISLREQLNRFEEGAYAAKDVKTQISAGWFDWFCRDTSLAAKTPQLFRILQRISNSPRINLDTMYAFFKNNCPVIGNLYDSISICDLETGKVLFWLTPSSGQRGAANGQAEAYEIAKGADLPTVRGKLKDVVTWFNTKDPVTAESLTLEDMKGVYDEFGVDIHSIPPALQSQMNSMVKEILVLRG